MKFTKLALLALLISGAAAAEKTALRGANEGAINNKEQADDEPRDLRGLQHGDQIPGSYIIQFKDDLDMDSARGLMNALSKIIGRDPDHEYKHSIKGCAFRGLGSALAKQIEQTEGVLRVEPDYVVSVDKKPDGGGANPPPPPPEQVTPWGIKRVGGPVNANDIMAKAWVIDTGIDLDHPDLNVDVSSCFDAYAKNAKQMNCNDGHFHGTHVAGTIAAIDNEFGVVGVAAGATVVPVKVLSDSGSGSLSAVIAGVDYVADKGTPGDVANMSLGGGFYKPLNDAVFAAASTGIKFVVAAGNDSWDATNNSPASAEGDNVYTISAMAEGDNFAWFSNFGSAVDYCAPGVNVLSTSKDGGYRTANGTSMAAPHAAGVLLLGSASTDGTVNGDPDGNADLIIHLPMI